VTSIRILGGLGGLGEWAVGEMPRDLRHRLIHRESQYAADPLPFNQLGGVFFTELSLFFQLANCFLGCCWT